MFIQHFSPQRELVEAPLFCAPPFYHPYNDNAGRKVKLREHDMLSKLPLQNGDLNLSLPAPNPAV